MKIKKTNLEAASIGDFKKIKSKIADKDLGLALTMVSKNLYSNPIGSFIREIASNAVDANVDANVDEAVLIHVYQEGTSYYIEFRDNGVGMNPEVFEEVYMSWFNSDKRESNDKIGGWGLGSKSPLSYQDNFEVITRSEGIEYHYVLANEGTEPDCDLLATNETSNPNGTTVRIEINNEDLFKVHEETIRQLAYFRNIYVKNDVKYYDNNFQLYEADKYILRNVNQPFGTEMHICLGQVAYPINWQVIGVKPINIPVGVKFEIGELDVTLSREEINYTEEVKKIVVERIEEVKEALLDKYKEQLEITDFGKYVSLLNSSMKAKFWIEDVQIDMRDFSFTPSFSPFPEVKFIKKYLRDLFSFYTVELVKGGRSRGGDSYINNLEDYIDSNKYNSYSPYLVTGKMNPYDSAYIGTGIALIKRKKITKKELTKVAKALNLLANVSEVEEGWNVKPIFKEGYLKTVFKVIKYIDNYVTHRFTHYNGIADDDWIANYKAEQRDAYEERKQSITHYNLYNNRTSENLGELMDNNKAIFYISKDETKETILAYEHLHSILPRYFYSNSRFLIISPSVITRVKNKRKFVAAEMIFKIKEFNNTLYRLKLSKVVDDELKSGATVLGYSKYYYKLYTNLYRTYKERYKASKDEVPVKSGSYTSNRDITVNVLTHFEEEFSKIKPSKHRKYMLYEEHIEPLKEIKKKLDILNYVVTPCPHNYLVQIIERLGVLNLNPEYYKRNTN